MKINIFVWYLALGIFVCNAFAAIDIPSEAIPTTPPFKKRKLHDTFETPRTKRIAFHHTPQKALFGTSISHNLEETLLQILQKKEDDKENKIEIYANSFFFTNEALAKALARVKNSLQENATIAVLIDKVSEWHSKKKVFNPLMRASIPLYVYQSNFFENDGTEPLHLNHCKYLIWSYKGKSGRRVYRVASGSANFTMLGLMPQGNLEQFMITKINKKEFNRYKNLFFIAAKNAVQKNQDAEDIRPERIEEIEPNPLERTPTKGHSTQISPTDDIIPSIVERINNTSSIGEIRVISYAFDAPALTEAFLRALDRGVQVHLVIDMYGLARKDSLQKTQQQLSDLAHAGAKIFVYKDKGIIKNHAKLLLINDGKRIICGHGSYNFTPTSETSFNTFHWLAKASASQALDLIVKQWNQIIEKTEPFVPTPKQPPLPLDLQVQRSLRRPNIFHLQVIDPLCIGYV